MENVCGKVLKTLKESGLARADTLAAKIGCSNQEVEESLRVLEDTFKIAKTRDGYYETIESKNRKVGQIKIDERGNAFVYVDNETIFIPPKKLRGCIHNDTVLIRTSEKGGRLEGIVEKRLSRDIDTFVGEVVKMKDEFYIIPDHPKYKIKVKCKPNDHIKEGHKVLFKLSGEVENDIICGQIEEIIGDKNDPGIDVLSVIKSYHISTTFKESLMDEVSKIPRVVTQEEQKNRLDLRGYMIFTIDGDDTKDIDDAVSLDILPNGNYLLGVHIADVSHYVKPGTLLDEEAKKRSSSIYLVDRVLPMLPPVLSNGICSLNPGVDRLTISFFIEIDKKGNIVHFDVKESVINSNIKMTYDKVNQILENHNLPYGYEKYASKLKTMQKLSHLLRDKRVERGCVDFDIDEIKMETDLEGKVTSIMPRTRGEGEKLIEEFMIAVNEAGAEYSSRVGLPLLYRVHELPRDEKIESLIKLLNSLEYDATKFIKNSSIKYSKDMQALLNDLKRRDDYNVLANHILRSVKKACYSTYNVGHFALSSKAYSHLTSPIRRYADLENHRLLKDFMLYHRFEQHLTKRLVSELSELGMHITDQEKMIQDLEREIDRMKLAEYMENYIGEEYQGIISDLSSKALYVQLPNLVEGRVVFDHYTDKIVFDGENYCIKNIYKNLTYRLGMPLRVKVIKTSKKQHIVDLSIVDYGKIKVKKVNCGNRK